MNNLILTLKGMYFVFFVYRKKHLKMGKAVKLRNVNLSNHNYFSSYTVLANVSIGDYSYTGTQTIIRNATIGKFCSIADNVKIGLGFHPIDHVSTHPSFYSNNKRFKCFSDKLVVDEYKPTIIGNDVWIGTNTIIFGGVTIGDGAIIAGGSIVTKDVDPYGIIGGNPAKLIKYRFGEDTIKKFLNYKWWEKDLSWIEINYQKFHKPEIFLEFIEEVKNND